MNVTLNTNRFNTYARPNYNNNRQQIPTFEGKGAGDLVGTVAKKSKIFEPINQFYENCTDFIARKFTAPLVDSKPMNYMAEKFKNSRYIYFYEKIFKRKYN